MSLYEELASLEAELNELTANKEILLSVLDKLNKASAKTDDIKNTSLNVLAIDDKAFREDIIGNAKANVERAAAYISGEALPMINKKISEVEDSIESVKERIKELEEENQ